ncbi:FecR family protein [Simiduia agarivorans]|uniref:Anti-FecI sigma factor FecR n=1 Tax=Simiduia agarivorans (strain DSM 21679 / JCM 13881 / BCRC 17597 / SA1) TaxID=1117647 RepID=K4KKD0_SIMAS|nr:FecR domain-containing protein [Simiduia agarivorans]AFU98498.1 anti-FecI sigma factor FecR [Simiduia agarivorans SA1 = DSM 21679]
MILQIHSEDLEQQAAIWAERQTDGLSANDQTLLRQWLEADARHRQAFARARTDSQRVTQMAQALAREPGLQSLPVRATVALDQPRQSKPWLAPLFATAAALLLAVFVMLPEYRTGTGEIRTIQLEDGSELVMNAGTGLDVEYTDAARRIILHSGEVFVRVAHNPDRPFTVHTEYGDARAVGTAYAVKTTGDQHQVVVEEGVVAVQAKTSPALLQITANQSVQMGQKLSPVTERSAEEVSQVLAWREHRLYFSNVALAEFVNEMNRFSHHKMYIADGSLSAVRVGGAFNAGDTGSALAMLKAGFGVEVVQITPWFSLLYPASEQASQ